MVREQDVKQERNSALVDVMLLAAAADGQASDADAEALLKRIAIRPEFNGTPEKELRNIVQKSLKRLGSAKSLEEVLASVEQRLPDRESRKIAFGLAAGVAFSDHRASRAELGLLKRFQAALGISEDEVSQIIDEVEKGNVFTLLASEPERLYAEVMVLVSAADGKLGEAEAQALVESLAADPAFEKIDPILAQRFVSDAVAALAMEGLPQRMQALTRGLATRAQRVKAFSLAMRIANASGRVSGPELKMLELLQASFGLANDEVERIRHQL
jgi:uncharacterized tellurite resistance protein B-like protein